MQNVEMKIVWEQEILLVIIRLWRNVAGCIHLGRAAKCELKSG